MGQGRQEEGDEGQSEVIHCCGSWILERAVDGALLQRDVRKLVRFEEEIYIMTCLIAL